jgi:hypothetical protein
MTSPETQVIRMRQSFEGEGKNTKKTRRFLDESTDQPIYTCDIVGHVARSRVTFLDLEEPPALHRRTCQYLVK